MKEGDIERLIGDIGGTVEEVVVLPDGSGFATATFPLPDNHWIYESQMEPPAPVRLGCDHPLRGALAEMIRNVGRYAVRASTMNGKEMDFDPDAMLQNLEIGLLGYWTEDGKSHI